MTKNSSYASRGFILAHRSLLSGVKRCFALMSALLAVILLGVLVTSCGIYIGGGPPSSSQTQPPDSTQPPVVVTQPQAPPATGSGNCQGQQQPSHDPNSGAWSLDPGNGYLIVHFWTNLAGHSQQERVLELTSGQAVTLKGGGSAWLYNSNCQGTADAAFANDSHSFPPVTVDQLRQEGLVA